MLLLGLPLESFNILLVFCALDIVTGVVRSYVLNGGHSITSKRFSVGLISKMMLLMIPLILAWTGKGAGVDLLFLAKGALSVLIVSESYSIFGNIYSIHTGKNQKEFDAIAFLLEKIQKTLLTLIKEHK